MKVMKTVLKKMRTRKYSRFDQSPEVRKLRKLRKWMNLINPAFHLGGDNVNC